MCTYSTVGTDTFTVPPYQTSMRFDLSGAGGGCNGLGGKAAGTLAVDPLDSFQLNMGGRPGNGQFVNDGDCAGAGFNGGGAAGSADIGPFGIELAPNGIGGAGATDVRIGAHALTDRIFVAGGGGGGTTFNGGKGGGQNGTAGVTRDGAGGGGGTQSAAGASPGNASSAGFGFGGGGGAACSLPLSRNVHCRSRRWRRLLRRWR